MDFSHEDVSIVIKENEDELIMRNQFLLSQLEEANEKIRRLVNPILLRKLTASLVTKLTFGL